MERCLGGVIQGSLASAPSLNDLAGRLQSLGQLPEVLTTYPLVGLILFIRRVINARFAHGACGTRDLFL